jgi:hypothetical protein
LSDGRAKFSGNGLAANRELDLSGWKEWNMFAREWELT